ncbi:MAG: hypothetical protein M3O70_08980 [Actinomycetota bacterium]|nr:hypothetical protein [Actinomycetota bacterium]
MSRTGRELAAHRRRQRAFYDALEDSAIEYVRPIGALSPGGSWDVLLDDRRVGNVRRSRGAWTYRCLCHPALRNARDPLERPATTRAEAAGRMLWHILDAPRSRRCASSRRV